ncbi:helix-turn-helix transcriptional regulator [Planctomycetota bacterium]
MNIGRAIRRFRQRIGMTQRALAEKVGITPTYLCLVENERREPAAPLVRSLCEALSVPAEVVFWDAIEPPTGLGPRDTRVCELAKQLVAKYCDGMALPHGQETKGDA